MSWHINEPKPYPIARPGLDREVERITRRLVRHDYHEPVRPTEAQREVLKAIGRRMVLTDEQEHIAQELRGMCLVQWVQKKKPMGPDSRRQS